MRRILIAAMTPSYEKAVADLIVRALLRAGQDCQKLSTAVDSFLNPERITNSAHVQYLPPHWGTLYELTNSTGSRCLLTPAQHRARAKQLRERNPNSRAAELAELAANAIEARSLGKMVP